MSEMDHHPQVGERHASPESQLHVPFLDDVKGAMVLVFRNHACLAHGGWLEALRTTKHGFVGVEFTFALRAADFDFGHLRTAFSSKKRAESHSGTAVEEVCHSF